MKITLEKQDGKFHYVATGTNGTEVQIDGSPAIGGEDKGARPMEMLLMALGGCSCIDIGVILERQRQTLEGMSVDIEGERVSGKEPSLFDKIHVTFHAKGDLDEKKLNRAVSLSMEKYCSVAMTLEKTAEITYSITLNGEAL
ncbi:MAG: hypothetical protein COB65_12280 [Thalassobium sp.]|nr:MAG: hypothetical protein COB65_12280 [Thalassobium sp.]